MMTQDNLKVAIHTINDFLFKGELSAELVKASLGIVAHSSRNRHLILSGYDASTTGDLEIQKANISAACSEALLRLEQHWNSMFGCWTKQVPTQ